MRTGLEAVVSGTGLGCGALPEEEEGEGGSLPYNLVPFYGTPECFRQTSLIYFHRLDPRVQAGLVGSADGFYIKNTFLKTWPCPWCL